MAICLLVITNQMDPVKCSAYMIGSPLFWLTAPEGLPLHLGSINTPSHWHKISPWPFKSWNEHTGPDASHTLWWRANWEGDNWCGEKRQYSKATKMEYCGTQYTAVWQQWAVVMQCGKNYQLLHICLCIHMHIQVWQQNRIFWCSIYLLAPSM